MMADNDRELGPRTLGLGLSLLRAPHLGALLLAGLGAPVLALAGLVFALACAGAEQATMGEVLRAVGSEFARDPGNRLLLWVLGLLAQLAAVVVAGQRLARIRVTPMGLQGYIPRWLGAGFFRQSAGRWDIRWQQVRRVRLLVPPPMRNPVQRLGWHRLVIETERGEIWLNPFAWFDRSGTDHRLGLQELFAWRALDPAARLQRAPLLAAVRARGFEPGHATGSAGPGPAGFDLARHAGMRVQLVLLFAAGLYALADTFFLTPYVPLGPMPAWPFVLAGTAAALAVSVLGRGVPQRERIVVATLVVAAAVAAVHPATLRINAATAERESATYMAVAPGRFDARDARLPAIDLNAVDVDAYWRQYPPGSEHEFTLLRGSAGFYQLDLAPLYQRTRGFYSRLRSGQ